MCGYQMILEGNWLVDNPEKNTGLYPDSSFGTAP
ncbi:hypothetical protein Pgin02_01439 [Porphyromonas gingivalis]